jgi:hypothetical protein
MIGRYFYLLDQGSTPIRQSLSAPNFAVWHHVVGKAYLGEGGDV